MIYLGEDIKGDISQLKESTEGQLPLGNKGYWLIKGINRLVPNRTDLVVHHGNMWCTTVFKDVGSTKLNCNVNGVVPYAL